MHIETTQARVLGHSQQPSNLNTCLDNARPDTQ
jgi:hypothetical protein